MYAVGLIVFFFCIFFLRGHLSRKSRYFVDEPNIATIRCHDRTDARRSLMKKTRQYLSECLKSTLPARTFAVNSLFEDNANNLSLSLSLFIFESIHTQDKLALFEDLGFCDAMDPDWEPLRLVLLMHINLILLRTNHTTIPEKNLGIQKHIEVSPVLWRRWRKNVADRKKCCKNRRSGSKQSLIRCDW